MNRNILIVLAGAVVIAVTVAVVVQMGVGKKEVAPVAVVEEAKVEVLVAARDLKLGREIAESDLRWQEWPKKSVFPGAILRADDQGALDAVSGRLARDIAEGEPVVNSAILGKTAPNFVAASLKPGMRAVAIDVSASTMVGGFIGPGDFVDVILTYKQKIKTEDGSPEVQEIISKNIDKLATETIVQNVQVLAVDQLAQRPDEDRVKVGKTITLALHPRDIEKIALAQQMGQVVLALRGIGDHDIFEKDWPTTSDARLTQVDDEILSEFKKVQNDAGVRSNIVRIYSGAQVQNVSVK